jgi:hypothetical protein
VNAAIEKVNNGQNRVLVLVPFDHLKDRFKTEFINVLGRTFGVYFWNTNVQTECYASIEKLDPTDYCMILGDEIHLGLTDRCMGVLSKGGKVEDTDDLLYSYTPRGSGVQETVVEYRTTCL